MVFNILVDNTDDHEKNHALLVVNPFANGRLRLAPAYDVLPSQSGQGQARQAWTVLGVSTSGQSRRPAPRHPNKCPPCHTPAATLRPH